MIRRFALLSALVLSTTGVQADWTLNNERSSLNFITTKNASKTEVHHFKHLEGQLSEKGKASLTIDLKSVETNIPIRNERMMTMLFDTVKFPDAKIELSVDPKKFTLLTLGKSVVIDTEASLSLHGDSKTIPVALRVTRMTKGFMVQNLDPVLIAADEFDLGAGVEALREIAKLASITTTVPVSFTLFYND